MARLEKDVIINAPIDKVYAFASDWRNLRRYFTYIQKIESKTGNLLRQGTELDLHVRFLGGVRDAKWVCTENITNQSWTFDATLIGIKAIKKWSLLPIGDTTKVTFNFEYRMQPPVLGPIVDILFIGPLWNRLYDKCFKTGNGNYL
jgi:ligand-binding SRPBCC domain-containing protein